MKLQERHTLSLSLEVAVNEAIACAKTALREARCNFVQVDRRILATSMNSRQALVQIEVSFESRGFKACRLVLDVRSALPDPVTAREIKSFCGEVLRLVSKEAQQIGRGRAS